MAGCGTHEASVDITADTNWSFGWQPRHNRGTGHRGEGRAIRLAENTSEADSKTIIIGHEWNSHRY